MHPYLQPTSIFRSIRALVSAASLMLSGSTPLDAQNLLELDQQHDAVIAACPEYYQLLNAAGAKSCLALIKSGKLNAGYRGTAYGLIGTTYLRKALQKSNLPLNASVLQTAIKYFGLAAKGNRAWAIQLATAHEMLGLQSDIADELQVSNLRLALSYYTAALAPFARGMPENRDAYASRGVLYGRLCKSIEMDNDFRRAFQLTNELNNGGLLDGEIRDLKSKQAASGSACIEKFRNRF